MASEGTTQAMKTTSFNVRAFRNKIEEILTFEEMKACIYYSFKTHDHSLTNRVVQHKPESDPLLKDFKTAAQKMEIKKAAGNDGEAITLHRIALAFPDITIALLEKHGDNLNLTPVEDLKRLTNVAEYPKIARHTACAAIIPWSLNTNEREGALAVILLPAIMLAEKQNEGKTIKSPISQLVFLNRVYVSKSFRSCYMMGDKIAVHLANKYGIVGDSGGGVLSLTEPWKKASSEALKILKEKYNVTKIEMAEKVNLGNYEHFDVLAKNITRMYVNK